ncbi:tetratricopeptide repeat protein [Streptosporangium sp. NPDC023825]|uniref:tetratricopeptide repeat protein n=1 Tax=Streptosporangium sp. NPDC023825 TaxID=3154909 RepID=UPI00343E7038
MRPFLERAHHDDALTLHSLALQRSRALGDRAVQARALADLAWTHWRLGEYERAEEHAHQALDMCEEARERALALLTLGNVALRRRDERAEPYLKRALDLTRIGADTWGEAHVLGILALVLDRAGRPQEARRHLDLALVLHRKVGNLAGEAMTLDQLGVVLRRQGELGNTADEAAALNGLAEAADDPARAVEEHTAALALTSRSGAPSGPVSTGGWPSASTGSSVSRRPSRSAPCWNGPGARGAGPPRPYLMTAHASGTATGAAWRTW